MKTVHVDILPPKAILPILLFLLLPKVESDPKIQLKKGKVLMKILLSCLMTLIILGFSPHNLLADERENYSIETICQETVQDNKFIVSLDYLYFENGHIVLNVEGIPYSVDNLKKCGEHWLATAAQMYYCRNLHPLCKQCNQCHTKDCRYYVRLCKQWENK